jgi:hypothetical protein
VFYDNGSVVEGTAARNFFTDKKGDYDNVAVGSQNRCKKIKKVQQLQGKSLNYVCQPPENPGSDSQ